MIYHEAVPATTTATTSSTKTGHHHPTSQWLFVIYALLIVLVDLNSAFPTDISGKNNDFRFDRTSVRGSKATEVDSDYENLFRVFRQRQHQRRHKSLEARHSLPVTSLLSKVSDPKSLNYRSSSGLRSPFEPTGSLPTEPANSIVPHVEIGNDTSSSPGAGTGSQRLPQAIIIGVKKGGTRALLEFLRVHPDVRAPGPEVHFFDRYYHRGLDWYRSQMPSTVGRQVTIEKTPSYFITKVAPARVYNMSRDIKLIVVVRDPVTRAISDYAQAVAKRPDLPPFDRMAFLNVDDGLDNSSTSTSSTSDFRQRTETPTGPVATSWGAIKIGLYARHLERWLRYFPPSQFHFVHGERLISDPAGELGLLQDFLGLRRHVTERHFYFNATKGFPCLVTSSSSSSSSAATVPSTTSRLSKTINRRSTMTSGVTSRVNSKVDFNGRRKVTENKTVTVISGGSGGVRCLGKTKGRAHPVVEETTLKRLRDFFRPFNEKFYRMAGVNFGW